MFDIAWCDKYDISVLCLLYFINGLISKKTFAVSTFIKNIYVCPFYKKEMFVAFSRKRFLGRHGVYVLSSISRTFFSTFFLFFSFSVYRGMLELKNDTSILRKNGWFGNKTCCSLTALFVKTEIDFCCCNFGNK